MLMDAPLHLKISQNQAREKGSIQNRACPWLPIRCLRSSPWFGSDRYSFRSVSWHRVFRFDAFQSLSQTRPVWDCHRTADRLEWLTGGLAGAAYMAVPWSVWVWISSRSFHVHVLRALRSELPTAPGLYRWTSWTSESTSSPLRASLRRRQRLGVWMTVTLMTKRRAPKMASPKVCAPVSLAGPAWTWVWLKIHVVKGKKGKVWVGRGSMSEEDIKATRIFLGLVWCSQALATAFPAKHCGPIF